jgi:hypothetical protein
MDRPERFERLADGRRTARKEHAALAGGAGAQRGGKGDGDRHQGFRGEARRLRDLGAAARRARRGGRGPPTTTALTQTTGGSPLRNSFQDFPSSREA